MKFNLSKDDMTAGVYANDSAAEGVKDPIPKRAEYFGINIDAVEAVAFGRALHVADKRGSGDFTLDLAQAAALGAMWMDGFFTALSAIQIKAENESTEEG